MSDATAAMADRTQTQTRISARAWTAWAFAGATLLGAFLLFLIQPLISKFILPWFGGAPAVWTTCMLFFQVLLFGGYAYSHLLASRLAPRTQVMIQILVLLAAVAVLPIAPKDSWKPADSAAPTARILLLLTATVGLPYFALSTTSPLIQAWFSRTFPGRMPYRLYSLSNFGSLLALLSYPFVFEPVFDLATQSRLWSWAFPAYAALMGVCGAAVWREAGCQPAGNTTDCDPPGSETRSVSEGTIYKPRSRVLFRSSSPRDQPVAGWPSVPRRILWLLLPAGASVMLLATTNHICRDVAPLPFLWVAPLSLYLLSFIVCFDHSRWYVRPVWAVLALLGIAAVMAGDRMPDWIANPSKHEGAWLTYPHELALNFGTLFAICMICHGELVRLRPDPRHLTEFYLLLSAGGALGGVFAGLVAPYCLRSFLEWNIGMLAAYAAATVVLLLVALKRRPVLFLLGFAIGGFVPLLAWQFNLSAPSPSAPRLVEQERNFYGVVSVWDINSDKPDERLLRLNHGAIAHGQQFTAPDKRRRPLTYFTADSGVGEAILELQKRRARIKVGVVGLGAGTLACYARPGDHFTFFEINPSVAAMAEKYFTFLSDARQCGATIDVTMGDGRLALDRLAPQHFDLLVLDAFSGGSVPMHLLTREAMDIYRRHVAADDVIAIHATNRYLYLFPVVRALADDAGRGWRRVFRSEQGPRSRSDWVVITDSRAIRDAVPAVDRSDGLEDDFTIPVWTDQNSNLFRILISHF
jgi:hypothetical protein